MRFVPPIAFGIACAAAAAYFDAGLFSARWWALVAFGFVCATVARIDQRNRAAPPHQGDTRHE